ACLPAESLGKNSIQAPSDASSPAPAPCHSTCGSTLTYAWLANVPLTHDSSTTMVPTARRFFSNSHFFSMHRQAIPISHVACNRQLSSSSLPLAFFERPRG